MSSGDPVHTSHACYVMSFGFALAGGGCHNAAQHQLETVPLQFQQSRSGLTVQPHRLDTDCLSAKQVKVCRKTLPDNLLCIITLTVSSSIDKVGQPHLHSLVVKVLSQQPKNGEHLGLAACK